MRTSLEVLHQYEDNCEEAMIQYAKEAIQEVMKQYWTLNSNCIRTGGKQFFTFDSVALNVMKGIK